jgi:hypothetical protein
MLYLAGFMLQRGIQHFSPGKVVFLARDLA